MASFIKYFKGGWEQIRTKRNGIIIKETGKWSNDSSTPVITQEIQKDNPCDYCKKGLHGLCMRVQKQNDKLCYCATCREHETPNSVCDNNER